MLVDFDVRGTIEMDFLNFLKCLSNGLFTAFHFTICQLMHWSYLWIIVMFYQLFGLQL